MRKLSTSYSKYFNKKYKRTGSLFEGTFKSTHIESDSQAKYIFSYIHLNPVKLIDNRWKENGLKDFAKAKKFLINYSMSSYLDYKNIIRSQNKILNTEMFPNYFSNIEDFDDEIRDWLSFQLINSAEVRLPQKFQIHPRNPILPSNEAEEIGK